MDGRYLLHESRGRKREIIDFRAQALEKVPFECSARRDIFPFGEGVNRCLRHPEGVWDGKYPGAT